MFLQLYVFFFKLKVKNISPQVYAASNVELITRTRTDHLTDQNKNKTKGNRVTTSDEGAHELFSVLIPQRPDVLFTLWFRLVLWLGI